MPLYLLPNVFSDEQPIYGLLPQGISDICSTLDGLIAESERAGRRYLIKVTRGADSAVIEKMRSLPIYLLNEQTTSSEMAPFEKMVREGKALGLVTDAGLPAIADPGSKLVFYLRTKPPKVDIIAVSGPSSITHALMLSGLPGQCFSFQGYLPKEIEARKKCLLSLEKQSRTNNMTMMWIETPYRNSAMLTSMLEALHPDTYISIASNLTFPDEQVRTRKVKEWRLMSENERNIPSVPTIFLIYAVQ